MLVLARKSQESVVVGAANESEELVRVTVLEVRGGTVKLGFRPATRCRFIARKCGSASGRRVRHPMPKPVAARPKYKVPYID